MANAIVEFPTERIRDAGGQRRGIVLDAVPLIEYRKELRRLAKMAKVVEGIVLSERLPLKEFDPDGDTYVVFQRPARFESEALARMQARSELIFDTEEQGRVAQRERVSLAELETVMVQLCLVESNLAMLNDKGEEVPIFVPGKTCRAARRPISANVQTGFMNKWQELPDELCEEIISLLRQFHPPFDWRNPGRGED